MFRKPLIAQINWSIGFMKVCYKYGIGEIDRIIDFPSHTLSNLKSDDLKLTSLWLQRP